ncbi:MAG TPA: glycosyltransferase family 4 protein, partial [Verrucomicrobiae bacterium]
LVANSYRGSQNLISRGADPARIKVLPNVLDLAEFDARSRMPSRCALPPGRIIAAAVGSLLPCKRFDRFLKALALAQRKAPNLFGVIAGADCGAGSALLRTADELGLGPGEVSFAGECDNVPALLAQSAFLVLCSDYEGFPNVILEAMGARLPVVTTPVGDAESIVQHDLTGYVVDGDHVEAIADRMAELALSPAARKRLGMEGRRRVVLEYNYEALSTRLLAVCRDFAVQNRKHDLLKSLEGGGLVASPSGLAGARLASEPAA